MTDEPIERALRDWLNDHTEAEAPANLQRQLDQLVDASGAVLQPVIRRTPAVPGVRRVGAQAIAVTAAIAVVSLVGGGLIYGLAIRTNPPVSGSLTPGGSVAPGSASPRGSASLAEPSPTVRPQSGGGPFGWSLVSSVGDLATYQLVDAITTRDGGAIGIAFGQEVRSVRSDDGTTWQLDPADPGLLDAVSNHLNLVSGIADGPAGLVVVGASALGDESSGDAQAWTSADGLHWKRAVRIGGDRNGEMRAVVGGKHGYVAVGSDGFPGASVLESGSRGAAVWASADGSSWTRVDDQLGFGGAVMTGITTTSTGYVAWGENLPMAEEPVGQPPIWTSTDGRTWLRADGSVFAHEVFYPLGGIAVGPENWIAVGTRGATDAEGGGSRPAAAISADGGRTWADVPVGATGDAMPSAYLDDIASVGSDLIATGHVEGPQPGGDGTGAAVWRSTDQGHTWTRLPSDPRFSNALMGVILPLDENRFVVFGQANDPNALVNQNLIWLATRQP